MSKLVKHIIHSLERTDQYISNVTSDVLRLPGMTGIKTRHFYNNICSMDDARYLEIGTWKGSSICSAMCNNKMTCTVIDNWSQFKGPKDQFLDNFNKFKGDNDAKFIEDDCWATNPVRLGRFNIYMYDGCHHQESHYKAVEHFLPCLDDEFIYLVDDWNWSQVRGGTLDAIKDTKSEILYQKEIYTSPEDLRGMKSDWHNGISIFVLKNFFSMK